MLEVKMGAEGFTNSGNEGSDDNNRDGDDHNDDSNQV